MKIGQEELEQVLQKYDKPGEYRLNETYSRADKQVYTKPGDKYHWLVAEIFGRDKLQVRKTDEHGKVVLRDDYERQDGSFTCTKSWRARVPIREKLAQKKEQVEARKAEIAERGRQEAHHKQDGRGL